MTGVIKSFLQVTAITLPGTDTFSSNPGWPDAIGNSDAVMAKPFPDTTHVTLITDSKCLMSLQLYKYNQVKCFLWEAQ